MSSSQLSQRRRPLWEELIVQGMALGGLIIG